MNISFRGEIRCRDIIVVRLVIYSPKDHTILLVDDDQDQLHYYSCFLEEEGFKVIVASSAREALSFLRLSPIDIIVSDFKMPGADGVEFIEYVRKSHIIQNETTIPIILFTSSAEISESVALNLGADRFCQKRNFENDLTVQIRYLLTRRI